MSNAYRRNTMNYLNKFNVGDKVKIYDAFTGDVKFQGIIIEIIKKACIKFSVPGRMAKIKLSDNSVIEDYMTTAEKIY